MDISVLKNRIRSNKLLYSVALIPYLPVKAYHIWKVKMQDKRILSDNWEILKKAQIRENDVLYFGVPRHMNAGDMAQTYCTRMWIADNYPGIKIHEFNTAALLNSDFLNALKEKTYDSNIIFLQSGYTTQDKHPDHAMHKAVVGLFPNNRIVFLPQTVNIKSEKEMRDTVTIFKKHSHLLFLVRDHISYDMIKNHFKGINVEEYPDIVTSLVGENFCKENMTRSGILLCLRNDDEKLYSTSEILQQTKKLECFGEPIEVTDTTLTDVNYEELYKNFAVVFQNILKSYRGAKVVITDRYHGTIFSAIADTPVIVLSTNDHKVKGGVDWFVKGGYTSVRYAESIEAAVDMAYSIMENYTPIRNNNYFKVNYYDVLKDKIELL